MESDDYTESTKSKHKNNEQQTVSLIIITIINNRTISASAIHGVSIESFCPSKNINSIFDDAVFLQLKSSIKHGAPNCPTTQLHLQ